MEKITRYMFVCRAAMQRSPTSVDVALNLAAQKGMNLEAECFGVDYFYQQQENEFKKCEQKFLSQNRIFVMEPFMAERIVKNIPRVEDKITCLNIKDNYYRGQIDLREILKRKISPFITKGHTYPQKSYAFVSLLESRKAQAALEVFKEQKKSQGRFLVDYITFDWANLTREVRKALREEENYDRIFIINDETFDNLMMPKPLSEVLINSSKNPEKYRNVEFEYHFLAMEGAHERMLKALRKAEK